MNPPESSTDSVAKFDANSRPYNPDLSPFYATHHRPEPKPGYFVLPENAVLKPWDVRWDHDNEMFYEGRMAVWNDSFPDRTVGQTAKQYTFNCCYFRKIENDPELYTRMQQYAAGKPVTGITGNLETAEQIDAEIARLEARKKELTEIKVGDWVVRVSNPHGTFYPSLIIGSIYRVVRISQTDITLERSNISWEVKNFRKATPAEVSAHLAKLEEEKRKVTVHSDDGRDYTAEFFPGYVQFGCAKIDNRVIWDCVAFLKQRYLTSCGNREITSIKIGKGTFTLEVLEKLAANLKA